MARRPVVGREPRPVPARGVPAGMRGVSLDARVELRRGGRPPLSGGRDGAACALRHVRQPGPLVESSGHPRRGMRQRVRRLGLGRTRLPVSEDGRSAEKPTLPVGRDSSDFPTRRTGCSSLDWSVAQRNSPDLDLARSRLLAAAKWPPFDCEGFQRLGHRLLFRKKVGLPMQPGRARQALLVMLNLLGGTPTDYSSWRWHITSSATPSSPRRTWLLGDKSFTSGEWILGNGKRESITWSRSLHPRRTTCSEAATLIGGGRKE